MRVQETGLADVFNQRIDQRYCPVKSPVEQSRKSAERLRGASACSPKEVCYKLLDYTLVWFNIVCKKNKFSENQMLMVYFVPYVK